MNASDLTPKLLGFASGLVGGAIAGALLSRFWRVVSDEDEVPQPTALDPALDRGLGEVLVVGALQGAVFGLVKAALSRLTSQGYRRFTGESLPS